MTDFIEALENDVELAAINELPFVALPTLAPGDTVTGTIGAQGDTEDTLSLHVVAGLSYTFTYSIDGADDITVIFPVLGSHALPDGSTAITYYPAVEATTGTIDVSILRDVEANIIPNTYTFSYNVTTPFAASQGDDIGVGTSETDTIRLINGNDLYYAYAGDDRVDGGNGNDEIYGGDGNDDVRGDSGNDDLYGGSGNDYAHGGRGEDYIDLGDGDDRARGQNDDDEIYGGNGNDRLFGDAGNDLIDGGANEDVIYGGSGDDEVYGGNGNDYIHGQNGEDQMYGGMGNDVMDGGNNNDAMFGGMGRDRMVGGVGDDLIDGGDDGDRVFGFRGEDYMILGDGNDTGRGGDDADSVFGGAGNDKVYGDAGDDVLHGGSGIDHLFGGTGSDTFVFEFGDERAVIRDFNAAEDVIDMTDFSYLLPYEFDSGLDFPTPIFEGELDLLYGIAADAFRETNGGDVLVDFGTGDVLTIRNTTLAELSVENFVLPDYDFIPEILG